MLDFRTRRPSTRSQGLPSVRPCANCHEERPIVSDGLCDRCRKRRERAENRTKYDSTGNYVDAMKCVWAILDQCRKLKLPRLSRLAVLEIVLPYSGCSLDLQQSILMNEGKHYDESE
jgi:hypothetical protein